MWYLCCILSYSTSNQSKNNKFNQKPCDICLGNVRNSAKYCATCKASFCVSHLEDHYKSPALNLHHMVNLKLISSEVPANESSLQWSGTGKVQWVQGSNGRFPSWISICLRSHPVFLFSRVPVSHWGKTSMYPRLD